MRDGETNRVFDRASWERKTREPAWFQRTQIEKNAAPLERKPEEW